MMKCLNCGHAAKHTDLVGCLSTDTPEGYCDCTTFVPERAAAERRDLSEGRALRDQGTAVAGDDAPAVLVSDWKAKAAEAMETLIQGGTEFSADDLVAIAGEPPVPNMLGGLFLGASRGNRIQPVGFTQSARPSAHARVQRTWKGE
jgi:hypothetical protein